MYVEDESGKATERFQHEIESAGFAVARAYSADDALARLAEVSAAEGIVDLVVLDRKLPATSGDRATEQTGDRLFEEIEAGYPDTPIIVLTGFSDEDFALLVLQRRNTLEIGLPDSVQRISHFKKRDALKFRESLRLIGGALWETENVAVEGAPDAKAAIRVLKRVAQVFDGAVLRARPAGSGSSESSVWLCEVFATDGRWLTSVVVKIGSHDSGRPSGGFMGSVPPANAAQPIHWVHGACGGFSGHVAPLAGPDAQSIAGVLQHDEPRAVEAVISAVEVLDQVPAASANIRLASFVSPLIDWSRAEQVAIDHEISLPDPHLAIPSRHGCLHGDLHPGNVLLVSGRPVFIDFDRQRSGSLIYDAISLALGAFFNEFGPLRDRPPTAEEVEQFLTGRADPSTWLGACSSTWPERGYGHRERWSALLAYALRQLKYDDNIDDTSLKDLAVQLARRASVVLNES
ncbi:phosphotransferase [Knoellia aerolata]|uniref:phosphotransferase n=1 Tax=Knoellia aerolata TaxID=442954 RepID=UPI0014702118|nr:phosphotransferase [Knoellia aerolata]